MSSFTPEQAQLPHGCIPAVMIVEDEAIIAFSLEDSFQDEGYEVVGPFSSCADALSSVATRLPSLAILDATLSDGSCIELARELRRRGVPFLVYSGHGEFEDHSSELDGITWIEKPASPDKVLRAAGALIGKPFDQGRLQERL